MKEIIEQINAFDVLKRMNEEDAKNKTALLPVSNYFVSGEKVRRGAHITMGVDADTWMDVFHNKRRCILLCIDNEAYKRVENELILESQQGKEEKLHVLAKKGSKEFMDNDLYYLRISYQGVADTEYVWNPIKDKALKLPLDKIRELQEKYPGSFISEV